MCLFIEESYKIDAQNSIFDECESARYMKALSMSLIPLINNRNLFLLIPSFPVYRENNFHLLSTLSQRSRKDLANIKLFFLSTQSKIIVPILFDTSHKKV